MPNIVLKTNTVKQLPQSVQVPTIYDEQFESTRITNLHLVIKAIRFDLQTITTCVDQLDLSVTSLQQQLNLLTTRVTSLENAVGDLESRMDSAESELSDHESRISALESPVPPPP